MFLSEVNIVPFDKKRLKNTVSPFQCNKQEINLMQHSLLFFIKLVC